MIGHIELQHRGKPTRLSLDSDLNWSGDTAELVDMLRQICPAPEGYSNGEAEAVGRHMLYRAAQRLGARVKLPRFAALA